MNYIKNYWNEKKVFITGGTSGLGKSLAIELSDLGAKIVILARTESDLKNIEAKHRNIIGIKGDISCKKSIHPIAAEAHSKMGSFDVLINAASFLGATPLRPLLDTQCEDFEKVLQTNLLGPFRLTKLLLPDMILRQFGIVVNISSDAAVNPYENWGAYGVSKAGLDHLSRIFGEELKQEGIKFLAIDPGDMNTPMHFAAIPDANPKDLKSPNLSASQILKKIASENLNEVRSSL